MQKVFRLTMSGLEAGLRVLHIASYDLRTCSETERAIDVFDAPRFFSFDRIPVRGRGGIIGILERRQRPLNGLVRQHMRSLDSSVLVSADEPLTKFVPLMKKTPFRLVLEGSAINAIVTRSDLAKPPVRLLAFTLVSHLEMIVTEFIRSKCPNEQQWFKYLDGNRQRKLAWRARKRRLQNLDLPLLELADLGDKTVALAKLCNLDAIHQQQLREIEELRNATAHPRDFGSSETEINRFIDRLSIAKTWIRRFPELTR